MGFIIAAEERFAFFRIHSILPAQSILSDNTIWGTIDSKYERFWPAFFVYRKDYESLIEQYYPIKAKLELIGVGKFKLLLTPLKPLYNIYWGGKYWYISQEKKLWLSTLDENRILSSIKARDLPVLLWSSDRTTPINLLKTEGNIFDSVLPLETITNWYKMAEMLGWTKYIKFIHAEMNEDIPCVEIIFYSQGDKEGARILLPDDAQKWGKSALAIQKLYGSIANLPSDIYIDCIYNDKILLRNITAKSDNKVISADEKNMKPENKN